MSKSGYKVSGVLTSGHLAASQAPAPAAPVTLTLPPVPAAAPAPAAQPTTAEWKLVDGQVIELDTGDIDDSPFQPEDEEPDRYDTVGIGELAQTIASEGQRDPIQVRRKGKRYELLAGHRRVRACRMLKRKVKAIIENLDDVAAERSVMVDNEGRKDRCDYRRAKLYRRALDRGYAKSQNDVAAMFATNASQVTRRLKMLSLPAPILALLDASPTLLSATAAETLLGLLEQYPDHLDIITQAAARQAEPGVTAQSIKPWVAQMIAAKTRPAAQRPMESEKERHTKVITDSSKRAAYTARLKGNVITLRLHSDHVQPETVLERVAEFLGRSANTEISKHESE